MAFLDKQGEIDLVDHGIRNKFKTDWLTDKDSDSEFFSKWLRKPKDAGIAYCFCQQYV